MMRSSQALSILGALSVIFGLGISGYQMLMPEAVSKSTNTRPAYMTEGYAAVQRAEGGLIILGVGAAMMLAGAAFERRRS
jgi:cyanate permease